MKAGRLILLLLSHIVAGAIGFAVGIYALPILTAPDSPSEAEVAAISAVSSFSATFQRDLEGSDAFHWGEGVVSLSETSITLMGKVSPGPDYKLYLSPGFVETEESFNQLKSEMIMVGDVKTFENFIVAVPESIDITAYNSVIVWCEAFGEFITAAKYQ